MASLHSNKPRVIVAMLAALSACGTHQAVAQTVTGNKQASMPVTFKLATTCAINRRTAVAFGTINADSLAIGAQGQGDFTMNCTSGVPYFFWVNLGENALDEQRRMKSGPLTSGAHYLPYNLYTDSSRTQAVPNSAGTPGTSGPGSGTGNGLDQTIVLYARIPSYAPTQVMPRGDDYSDRIVVTVTW
ncbi:Csu type fimbrial protein [Sphingomonas fennica]|uniref:Spore coat protein U/FanG domain-containing protein n=1 Tax=Edaphosphingomonas fennica TaxID=114404 RepID=A0A2T4I5H1_9SPHN|nr:spore coat U domain-containing protein [Sphingomonas fennica]PTD25474.1 hypothetical protein CV103_05725 [Sphingomonas fennica]